MQTVAAPSAGNQNKSPHAPGKQTTGHDAQIRRLRAAETNPPHPREPVNGPLSARPGGSVCLCSLSKTLCDT